MVKSQRGPNGRALNKDGTERKERTKLTPIQKHLKAKAESDAADRSLGNDLLRSDEASASLLKNVGIVAKWRRDAVSYSTEKKVEDIVARAQETIDRAQERAEASKAYLATTGKGSDLDTVKQNVGAAVMAFMDENEREPDSDEGAEICARFITDETREALLAASDPANDPFAAFRRDADEDEGTDEDDSDTLD